MKKFLLAAVSTIAFSPMASAADIVEAPVLYDWTGFYIGGNAGVAWNNSNVDASANSGDLGPFARQIKDEIQGDQTVFTGGGEIGYNWQAASFVMGLEADFNYLGFSESSDRTRDIPGLGTVDTSLDFDADWFGTVRGRLGYAADRFLIYATGGLAYGHAEVEGHIGVDGNSWDGDESTVNWGWTLGGGAEFALDENWIIGAEYLYVDLGSPDWDFESNVANDIEQEFNGDIDVAFSVVRGTVKFKFY